jgi:hypothetical protein
MSRRTTTAPAEKSLPSIVNQGYFSDYFLAYRLDAGLDDLYKNWDAAERIGDPTPRTRLRSLSTAFDKYRVEAANTAPDTGNGDTRLDLGLLDPEAVAALTDLNDAVLTALGWTPTRGETVTLTSGDKALHVPVAARCETPTGLLLVAVDTVFATDPATVVADKAASSGSLLNPVLVGDKPEGRTVLEAAQLVFTADEPPTYILMCSGGSLTLLDRDRWGEGVYLAASLDDAVARGDSRARGELAAIAALFSADVINPGERAQSVLGELIERAANESAGVSKDLRHGVRRSVEILANAVVRDIRHRQRDAWRPLDADDLTRQCLRYLYRIIVLLFAEARPELGILPVDDPDYQAGYSLGRLRATALVELSSEQARNANHLQQSLDVLFRAVNEGHEPEGTLEIHARGLTFPGLGAALFAEGACPLLDHARIDDHTLQQVLAHLCYTRERRGRERQAVSYATLGINQLGAVYEGLMAYRGFLATEELLEIDNDGNVDTGTWVIPASRAGEFPPEVFVTEDGPDGQSRRVRYRKGDFVFRLSGRDRKRSASYYTPETLTALTVKHALDVMFEERGLASGSILKLTVCEPALGSGAFLNEAINQLAARYLKAVQDELGETLDPSLYAVELQKAKAHFAINQAHGVDLNETAIDLAKVSLWLNSMHNGLAAPDLGVRLRRGNSLVGCRRATYQLTEVEAVVWVGKSGRPPRDKPLADKVFGQCDGIHHFLLPGAGWGAAADAAEVNELEREWAQRVKQWRRRLARRPTQRQMERLSALATRVEEVWHDVVREMRALWRATHQPIAVWGMPGDRSQDALTTGATWGQVNDPRSATARLRTLMDAWCSLWVWGPADGDHLPEFDEWLTAAEDLLRLSDPWQSGVLFRDDGAFDFEHAPSIDDAISAYPWLARCREIADRNGWFHWELEYAAIFEQGGFDLVVGNPPWTKVSRTDTDVLLDAEPLWAITGVPRDGDALAANRERLLRDEDVRTDLLMEAALSEGLGRLLSSRTRYPATASTLTNLYLCFIEQSFRLGGVTGLLHQESFYEDAKAQQLRQEVLLRLRRHWHFVNELLLFEDVDNHTEFGVHIGSTRQDSPQHLYAANLLHPSTLERSLERWARCDFEGDPPGKKTDTGEWDLRPHGARILTVDSAALAAFARLEGLEFDLESPPRPLRLYATVELELLEALASVGRRLRDLGIQTSSGIHESSMARPGKGQLIERRVARPASIDELVVKGPNVNVANPCFQEANEAYSHSKDNRIIDLEAIPSDFLPRTVLQRVATADAVRARLAKKDGWDPVSEWRQLWPEHVSRGWVRMFQPAVIPPRALHGHSCMSATTPTTRALVRVAGLSASVLYEVLLRMLGTDHLGREELSGLPYPSDDDHSAWPYIEARVMRLNAITAHYGPLWSEVFSDRWRSDAFVLDDARLPDYSHLGSAWEHAAAFRSEFSRWVALIELDALTALILGVDPRLVQVAGELHLGLQARYDRASAYDAAGAKLSGEFHNRGARQSSTDQYKRCVIQGATDSESLGAFVPPFTTHDRWQVFMEAYEQFARRIGGRGLVR